MMRAACLLFTVIIGLGIGRAQTFEEVYQFDYLSSFYHLGTQSENYALIGLRNFENDMNEVRTGLTFTRTDLNGGEILKSEFSIDTLNIDAVTSGAVCYPEGLSFSLAITGTVWSNQTNEIRGVFLGFDEDFNVVKQVIFETYDSLQLRSIAFDEVNDRFVVMGNVQLPISQNQELYVAFIDTNGVVISDSTYGGLEPDLLGNAVLEDDLIILSSLTYSYANPHPFYAINASNGYFLALNLNGELQWENVIWSDGFSIAPKLYDNGLFVHSVESPPALVSSKFSRYYGQIDLFTGDILWSDTLKSEDIVEIKSIKQTHDGGYLVMYRIENDSIPSGVVKLKKLDSNRDVQWERIYSGKPISAIFPSGLDVDDIGNILVWGSIVLEDSTYEDSWLLKLDSEGCLSAENCGLATFLEEIKDEIEIMVYPNPSKALFNYKKPSAMNNYIRVQVFDLSGQNVFTRNFFLLHEEECSINLSDLKGGVYILQVSDSNGHYYAKTKIIVE